ncbi:hypothetical protein ACEZCY_13700 [Streptacidiphilus sp. N1-12]|uniref:RICIN domain-containing protein n=2 Tax=Streptacidiphilus alkalitolerans TaxID=3342712 RepID=A0ABV6WE46_9ACTN
MRRVRMATFVALVTAGLVATAVAPAQAQITWNYRTLQNSNTGQCVTVDFSTFYANMQPCTSANAQRQEWNLIYGAPDAGGHAYELIQNSFRTNICLRAMGAGTGPSQIAGSSDVEGATCNRNDPSQVWAMSTQSAPSNGYSHIQFFTFGGRDCLDGGIGIYGFPEEGCNPGNSYQTWNVSGAQQ